MPTTARTPTSPIRLIKDYRVLAVILRAVTHGRLHAKEPLLAHQDTTMLPTTQSAHHRDNPDLQSPTMLLRTRFRM